MTDSTIARALIARIEELAVAREQQAATITRHRTELDAERAHSARLAQVAKDGQDRLSEAAERITELEMALEAAEARAKLPQRRIDVVTSSEAEAKVAHLGHTEPTPRKVPALIEWLREPVGGAS